MKKVAVVTIISFIVVIGIFAFFLRPSKVSSLDDVLMTVVPASSNSVQITILNNTNSPISFSNEYHIEARYPLFWHRVNLRPAAFTALGHELDPGDFYSASLDYETLYGDLSPGQYRLVKTFEYDNISTCFAGYFSIE